MITHTCDRCGKSSTQKKGKTAVLPGNWFALYYNTGYGSSSQTFELCPECRIALKIPANNEETHVGDHLIELIEEIVAERMEEGL